MSQQEDSRSIYLSERGVRVEFGERSDKRVPINNDVGEADVAGIPNRYGSRIGLKQVSREAVD